MMNNRAPEWSDEDVETLRRLVSEGLTTAVIGTRLGRSRNAIIGKCHRIGLFYVKLPRANQNTDSKGAIDPARHRMIQAILRKERAEKEETMKQLHLPTEELPRTAMNHFRPLPGKRTIGLEDLTSQSCRWPLDVGAEHRYCGDPAFIGSPYCPYHTRISSRR